MSLLPTDKQARKNMPIATGVLDYFPRAIAYVAYVSKVGNDQHNPGEPLHWAKEKSTDHADTIARHLIERGSIDTDGVLHSGKTAWRALALLETELEEAEHVIAPGIDILEYGQAVERVSRSLMEDEIPGTVEANAAVKRLLDAQEVHPFCPMD